MNTTNPSLSNDDLSYGLKQQHSGLLQGLSSKQQKTVDGLNSRYTYEHVSFFRQTFYELLMDNDFSHLHEDQIQRNLDFIKIMLKLIDYPYQTFTVKGILESDPVAQKTKTADNNHPQKTVKTHANKAAINSHIEWIAEILKQKEVSTLSLLDSYYSRFLFQKIIQSEDSQQFI